jgi:hypothetical protein
VQKAYKEYSGKDVVVMSVSLDGGDGSAVKKYLGENRYTMPTGQDKGLVYARAIGVRGVPSTVILDREQNIVARGFGPLDPDRPDVKKLIEQTLRQKAPLTK